MSIQSKPTHIFSNKQGKKIYCWDNNSDIIFSLNRLDKGDGKYKAISKNETDVIVETATKLGLSREHYRVLLDSVEKPKQRVSPEPVQSPNSSMFYNDNDQLRILREEKQNFILGKVGTYDEKGKMITSVKSNINELAMLAGTFDNASYAKARTISESNQNSPYEDSPKPSGMFNSSVKINNNKALEQFYGKKLPKEEVVVLKEGKDDRIILGRVNVAAQPNGLYKIEVENLPGEGAFHAQLYTAITKYLDTKLRELKDSNPDVAAYENTTEGELSGKQGASDAESEMAPADEDEVDLGFETPPPTTGGAEGAVAGVGADAVPSPEAMGAPAV